LNYSWLLRFPGGTPPLLPHTVTHTVTLHSRCLRYYHGHCRFWFTAYVLLPHGYTRTFPRYTHTHTTHTFPPVHSDTFPIYHVGFVTTWIIYHGYVPTRLVHTPRTRTHTRLPLPRITVTTHTGSRIPTLHTHHTQLQFGYPPGDFSYTVYGFTPGHYWLHYGLPRTFQLVTGCSSRVTHIYGVPERWTTPLFHTLFRC